MSDIYLTLPINGHPTELLSQRFDDWRKVLRSLSIYLKEYAAIQDDVAKQQSRLGNSVKFPYFYFGTPENAINAVKQTARAKLEAESSHDDNLSLGATTSVPNPPDKHPQLSSEDDRIRRNFAPYGSGSLSDVPAAIISLHNKQAAVARKASDELTGIVIPRLEDLRYNLSGKVKEIKGLASDFKNSVEREQNATKKSIEDYEKILALAANDADPKKDPYILKTAVDAQLSRQVHEENYLIEAYTNIQNSSCGLEKLVVGEIQQALRTYSNMVETAAHQALELSTQLNTGILAKPTDFEWNSYVITDGNQNFLDLSQTKTRDPASLNAIELSPLAKKIRAGYLERRSKYLKNYSKAWYVLTPSFLHEFKTPQDSQPILSLSLTDCQISRDTKQKQGSNKFVLNTRDLGASTSKGHNWVFRAENGDKMEEWFKNLSEVVQLKSPVERAQKYAAVATTKAAPVKTVSAASEVSADTKTDSAVVPSVTTAAIAGAAIASVAASKEEIVPFTKVTSSSTDSISSQVSSVDEPYAVENEDETFVSKSAPVENVEPDVTQLERPTIPGSFPSAVSGLILNTNNALEDSQSKNRTTESPVNEDTGSVFSYDLKKETNSTLPDDHDFKPIDAHISVSLERKLTETHHKDEDPLVTGMGIGVAQLPAEAGATNHREAVARRRSSVTVPPIRRPSRKATGSLGVEPLSSTDQPQDQSLFFAGGLPSTTSSAN